MKKQILIQLATQGIRKNKMRAALTMLGIIIGVTAVIVMVAVGYYPSRKAASLNPIQALRYE